MTTTRERAAPLFAQGLRDVQVAEAIGVTRERVRQLRKALGFPKTPQHSWTACVDCGKRMRTRPRVGDPRCLACWHASHTVTVTCAWCGKERFMTQSQRKSSKTGQHFCNRSHRSLWFQGKGVTGRQQHATVRVLVTVSTDEYKRVTAAAFDARLSLSEYIRRKVLA